MKHLIRITLSKLLWILSKVYSYTLNQRLKSYRNVFYTLWIQNFLGHYPCSLQGGGQKNISIVNHTGIQSHSILGCWEKYGDQDFTPSIMIGDNCSIGEYNHITACNKITIGNGLLTGRYVYIGDNAHGGLSMEEANIPPIRRRLISKGEILIGNNVWIGDKVTILGGCKIGDNTIIGANAVVVHDVPCNCIVAGNPARIIRKI